MVPHSASAGSIYQGTGGRGRGGGQRAKEPAFSILISPDFCRKFRLPSDGLDMRREGAMTDLVSASGMVGYSATEAVNDEELCAQLVIDAYVRAPKTVGRDAFDAAVKI
jgi:hypothetical protein